ncbi:hypothetical protein L5D93_00115 [Paenibacillus thiaminolyticus]|nr:hypothetical protein [Paenibacillus thiaminolyticus]
MVGSMLSNKGLKSGFYFREIGVFAQDPDEGEILYSYGNSGENAEYIPPEGGPDVIEKYIDAVTIIQNAQNVSAVMDESLIYPTKKEMESAIAGITPESIGAETPTGAQEKADAALTVANQYTDENIIVLRADVDSNTDEIRNLKQSVDHVLGMPLEMKPGLQVVEVENDTPFQMGEVKGRTLINLLGKEGNFDYRSSRLFTFFGTGEIVEDLRPSGPSARKSYVTARTRPILVRGTS